VPRRAWESRPGTTPPTSLERPSPPLCDAMQHGRQQPRGIVPPTPVRLTHRYLEKGQRSPRRRDGRLLHARTGLCRDVGPAEPVTSVAIGPVPPSPPSRRHPRCCGSMRREDTTTPATVPRMASRQRHPRVLTRATTEQATPTPPPSKPLLDAHRTRHDAPPEARFARTAVYSTALYAIPPHVTRTVWHACKLPPPWPIKRGAIPRPQGDDGQRSLACFPPSPRYWHLPQSVPLGPGGPAFSPATLVAPLCKHHGAPQYSAPSTPLLDVRPRPEPG
jgi:hypothetical protein